VIHSSTTVSTPAAINASRRRSAAHAIANSTAMLGSSERSADARCDSVGNAVVRISTNIVAPTTVAPMSSGAAPSRRVQSTTAATSKLANQTMPMRMRIGGASPAMASKAWVMPGQPRTMPKQVIAART
jgi:hypothetical protein